MAPEPDAVADCVLAAFHRLPDKRKPRPRRDAAAEWVPLAGIVLTAFVHGKLELACVSLGSVVLSLSYLILSLITPLHPSPPPQLLNACSDNMNTNMNTSMNTNMNTNTDTDTDTDANTTDSNKVGRQMPPSRQTPPRPRQHPPRLACRSRRPARLQPLPPRPVPPHLSRLRLPFCSPPLPRRALGT
jgi:hypothetical protein